MSTFLINPSTKIFNYTSNSILFTCTGSPNTLYDFVVPTSNPLTIVAVGAGGGGVAFTGTDAPPGSGGGYLRWTNNISFTRGTLLRITVGANGVNWAGSVGSYPTNGAKAGGYSSVSNPSTGGVYILAPGGHSWTTLTSVSLATFQSTGNRGTQTRSSANGSFATGSYTVDGISYTVSGGDGGNGGNGINASSGGAGGTGGAAGGGGAGGYTGNGGAGGTNSVTLVGSTYQGGTGNGSGGSGGGGGGGRASYSISNDGPNNGGGVGIYGAGSSGSGATTAANPVGGSGSYTTSSPGTSNPSGTYGAGAGGRENSSSGGNSSQDGAVWIRWSI